MAQRFIHIYTTIGFVLLCVSFGLFWSSIPYAKSAQLGIAFAGKNAKKLVMDGPYKFIRHPFYSSYLLVWIGGYLVAQDEILIITTFVMAWFYFSAIRQEERILLNGEFGELYKSYILKTGSIFTKNILNILNKNLTSKHLHVAVLNSFSLSGIPAKYKYAKRLDNSK